jgi:argininosuccinate lyase
VAGGDPLEIGGRLLAPPARELIATAFAAELDAQRGLQRELGLADLAHTVALVEAGVIPRAPGAALLAALLELHDRPGALEPDPARGDLYTNREAWIGARTDAVGWLGAGRARREALVVALHLALRARLAGLAGALVECGEALVARGAELRDALAPDYTYLQAAQPTSFGHFLLGTVGPLLRSLDRLRAAHRRVDLSPAGTGSGGGTRLCADRERLAALLGFAAPVPHTRDATWQADVAIEIAGLCAGALVGLDRLAEDLMFFAAAELGFVELDDGHARASKVMPQKKNPFALAYVRAAANRAIGAQAGIAAASRTPSGQMDNRLFAYAELPRGLDEAAGAAGLLAGAVRGLRFVPERAAECLARSFTGAADLAERMVLEEGLDYRAAHRRVAATAREGGAAAPDPAAAVASRAATGGAAPGAVDALVAAHRRALAGERAWAAETGARAAAAEEALVARARRMAGRAP